MHTSAVASQRQQLCGNLNEIVINNHYFNMITPRHILVFKVTYHWYIHSDFNVMEFKVLSFATTNRIVCIICNGHAYSSFIQRLLLLYITISSYIYR